jgi:hypothetical protein
MQVFGLKSGTKIILSAQKDREKEKFSLKYLHNSK